MIRSIFKLSSIQIGLLLILMPFSVGMLDGVISLISIFKDFEFEVPLFEIALFIVHILFLSWVWSISIIINKKTLKINSKLFKISFFIYSTYRLIDFLVNLNLDIFKKGWYLENTTINLIEIIVLIYGVIVFVSYIYLGIFTGKIVTKISVNKPKRYIDKIPYFLFILAFPLGIPLLQSRIQNYLKENILYGFKQSQKKHFKKIKQKSIVEVEDKIVIKKEEIDKEDPRRFMPK